MGKIYYNGVDYSSPIVSGVSGIKGNAESTYRTGNVNITATNIGLGNVNNTADNDKSVRHATTADNASYTNYINNTDDVNGHEIEIGYKAPVTDYTKLNYIAGFTSDNDELILRPIDSSVIADQLPVARTDEAVNGIITFGNSDDYGIRTNTDNYGRIGDSSKQFYEVHAKSIYENKTLLSNKYAVKSHASTSSSTYGCATASNFGHVKLSDNYTSSAGAASSGVAVSSKALYDAYTALNTKFSATELYNSTSTAFNANITLSQNVSNFKTIEIFFVDNDGDDNSIRIRAASGKFKMISHAYVGGTWYDKFTYYAVSGTKLNFSSSYQKNQGGVVESGNYHKIYRVIGYK
jgi:hypothetical protein